MQQQIERLSRLPQAKQRVVMEMLEGFRHRYQHRDHARLREAARPAQLQRELARRFAQLEMRLDKKLTKHDEAIAAILSAIRQLMGKSSTH